MADGGTLFLDEIGELPIEIQAALLRVIQEGIYKRVGSDTWRRANFRLVCATHRELTDTTRFRADLYHRLACWRLRLPPLRERSDDILALFEHFARLYGVSEPQPDASVAEYLKARSYPGNVRELKQLAARICRRHVGGLIGAADIPEDERPRSSFPIRLPSVEDRIEEFVGAAIDRGMGLKGIRRSVEDAAVSLAIERCEGSVSRAAEILEVTPRALQLRLASRREGDPGVCPEQ
jgi:DNA-binding NtrC family response regulator